MRSFEVPALLVSGLACLSGCGGAARAPVTPTQDTTVVNLDASAPGAAKPRAEDGPSARYVIKGPQDNPDPHAARAAALRDAAEFGKIGVLSAMSDQDLFDILMGNGGVPGGVVGGVVAGTGGGLGGMGGVGLRGVGVGGGGTGSGIGLGSIGTLGHGGGGGTGYGYVAGSGSGNPVSGDSVLVSSTGVVELGDALTLGVSQEQAARVLRDRLYALRNCYAARPGGQSTQAGGVTLRLVVGRAGRVASARAIGSDFTDAAFVKCVSKAAMDAYLGVPEGGLFGVVETVVRFRPPLKK